MKKLLIFLICFAQIKCINAQPSSIILSKNLNKIQLKSKLPGFSVAIIKNDKVIFSDGFGFADIKSKKPFTINTIQPVGSVSKTFIGFALLKAIDLGYFTLETEINEILPFKIINPNIQTSNIKVKDLTTHTSGIMDNQSVYLTTYSIGERPKEALSVFLKEYFCPTGKYYSKTNFADKESGKMYNYSNIAAALAAYLIELKSNLAFDEFTKKHIFEPIGMNQSHWFFDQEKSKNYATLYEINKKELPEIDHFLNSDGSVKTYSCITYPDGSLKTSVSDLSKYVLEMVKGLEGKSVLLSQNSYKSLFEKQFSTQNMPSNMDEKETNRSIFWGYNRKGYLFHTGGDLGVSAFVRIHPETKNGLILIINTQLDEEKNIESFKKIVAEIERFYVD